MDFSTYHQAILYIKNASKALPKDHRDAEYFKKALKNLPVAHQMATDDEKRLMLIDTAVKVANQLSFILFREHRLTPELEKEYRELPSPEITSAEAETANKKRVAASEELSKQIAVEQNKQKDVDIFIQVMGGLSKEEAEKKYNDYIAAGGR